MSSNYMSYLGSGNVPRPMGTAFPTVVPYRVFPALDRGIALAVGSEKLWAAFCRAIERPDLEKHPDYATNPDRIRNRASLEPLLAGIFREGPAEEWIARLRAAGIPCSPVRNFKDVAEDPQCAVREMFPVLDHRKAGPHRVTGTSVKLSATPGRPVDPAPLLGEHTRAVLREFFSLDDSACDGLARRGVIVEAQS